MFRDLIDTIINLTLYFTRLNEMKVVIEIITKVQALK